MTKKYHTSIEMSSKPTLKNFMWNWILFHLVVCSRIAPEERLLYQGKSSDKLRHPRSDAYSAEQVVLNKQQQIWGGVYIH